MDFFLTLPENWSCRNMVTAGWHMTAPADAPAPVYETVPINMKANLQQLMTSYCGNDLFFTDPPRGLPPICERSYAGSSFMGVYRVSAAQGRVDLLTDSHLTQRYWSHWPMSPTQIRRTTVVSLPA